MTRQLFKSILVVVLFTTFSAIRSQAQDIHYTFKVGDVNSLATAKPVTTIIRSHFNTEDQPNQYFPFFDVNTLQYDFISTVMVTQSTLSELLFQNGYVLTEFEYELISDNKVR